MLKITCSILMINFCFLAIAPALHGTCQLCEDIRERNRQNPSSGYTYYEDYLKAQGNQNQGENNQKQPEGNQKNSPQQNQRKAPAKPPASPQIL